MSKPRRAVSNRVSNRRPGFLKVSLLAIVGVYVVWVVFSYVSSVFKTSLVKSEVAEKGHIESVMPFDGTLVRDETVLSAPVGGKLKVGFKEGERVRVGATVASIDSPDINGKDGMKKSRLSSPCAGIVNYHLDGLETLLTLKNIDQMDLFAVKAQNQLNEKVFSDGQAVEGGQTVVKIVNNLVPMIVLGEVNGKDVPWDDISTKKQLTVQPDTDKDPITLNVVNLKRANGKIRFALEFNNYDDRYLFSRNHRFSLVTQRFEGYILPAKAIINRAGKTGVFIVYKNVTRWRPVTVVGQIGDRVAVSDLDSETYYIVNPQLTQEGQVIN